MAETVHASEKCLREMGIGVSLQFCDGAYTELLRTGEEAGPQDGPPKPERAIRIARRGLDGSEEILQEGIGKDDVSRRCGRGKQCLQT